MKKRYILIILLLALIMGFRTLSLAKYKFGISKEVKLSSEKFYANGNILYDTYVKEDEETLITNLSLDNYVSNDFNNLDTVFEISIISDIYDLKIGDEISDDGKMEITVAGNSSNSKNLNLSLVQKEGTSFNNTATVNLNIKTTSPYEKTILNKQITIVDEKNLSEHIILKRLVWLSKLKHDGYRYIGINPDNYVCFGTNSKNECVNDQDKYMYRIIGVFYDSNDVKHTKLIKYKQLKNKSLWFNTDSTATWGTSTVKDKINGTHFLTNTSAYPYLETNSKWYESIILWNYSGLIRASSSDVFTRVYNSELEATKYYYKIGLMYLSDIGLSLGERGLNTYVWRNTEYPLINSWMHQNNNDTSIDSVEWTMSIYCNGCSHFYANGITSNGTIDSVRYNVDPHSSRPVFYLTDSMEYVSGNGTKNNPYIIINNN